MNGGTDRAQAPAASLIGWLVLAAAITQMPAVVAMILTERIAPTTGMTFLLSQISIRALLLFVGGCELLLGKFVGYYCVYLVTFFGAIGGFKNPYVPFLKRWVNFGPRTEDLFLGLNLVIVAILIWEHWQRSAQLGYQRQRAHRLAIVSIMVAGLGWIGVGQGTMHRESGQMSAAAKLPLVGPSFADFATTGMLDYVSVETRFPKGITLVFSGRANQSMIENLAQAHRLSKMEEERAHQKFLPQAKAWRLDEKVFPTRFSDSDLYYAGRLKEMAQVTLQVVYRKSDGRFTAQVFGIP